MPLNPLSAIQQAENSSGNPTLLNQSGSSTASGLYQITSPTWSSWAAAIGVDTNAYPTAASAPANVQTSVAQYGYDTNGFQPWLADPASTDTTNPNSLASIVNASGGTSAYAAPAYPSANTRSWLNGLFGVPGNAPPAATGGLTSGTASASPLSTILSSITAFLSRAGIGVFGIVLIAIGLWAIVRERDVAAPIARRVKHAFT